MPLPLSVVLALSEDCAPQVAPLTLAAIVQVESGFDPLAIGVNGTPRISVRSDSPAAAAAKAADLIASGRSVDLGLAQINSANLGWLGLSVEAAFDPCRNLAAAARVLQAGYSSTDEAATGQQTALRVALSRYNTGNARGGFANGYVGKVTKAAAEIVPALRPGPVSAKPPIEHQAAATPAWDVFGEAADTGGFLIRVGSPTPPATGARP